MRLIYSAGVVRGFNPRTNRLSPSFRIDKKDSRSIGVWSVWNKSFDLYWLV